MAEYIDSNPSCATYPFEEIEAQHNGYGTKPRADFFRMTRQIVRQKNQIRELEREIEHKDILLREQTDALEKNRALLKDMVYKYFPHLYNEEQTGFDQQAIRIAQGINELLVQSETGCSLSKLQELTKHQRESFHRLKDCTQENDIISEENSILRREVDELSAVNADLREKLRKMEMEAQQAAQARYLDQQEQEEQSKELNICMQLLERDSAKKEELQDFVAGFYDLCYKVGIDSGKSLGGCLRDLEGLFIRASTEERGNTTQDGFADWLEEELGAGTG